MEFSLADLLAFFSSIKALADKVTPTEEIFITISKAPQVLCYHCGGEICYVKDTGRPAGLENFAPLQGRSHPGWTCPGCKKDIRAWLPEGAVIKTNRGILQC